jgi:hypothetical protein
MSAIACVMLPSQGLVLGFGEFLFDGADSPLTTMNNSAIESGEFLIISMYIL